MRNAKPPVTAMAGSTQWVLATSGTTGTPKLIRHSLHSLSSKLGTAARDERLCWGLFYAASRFAGLQVVLHAMITGSPLAIGEDDTLETQLPSALRHGVTAVSATPSLWRKLLFDGRITGLTLKQITLGGEIADQPILDALATRFPTARITHVYASTEAGSGFAVSDNKAGFPLDWLDNDSRSTALKIGDDGHLLLKPQVSAAGAYIARCRDAEGYLDTGDLVRIDEPLQRVMFVGRASGAINVGGNKVIPEQVEAHLLAIDKVVDAKVYAKASSILGALVAADIVLAGGANAIATQRTIKEQGLSALEPWQRPAVIRVVEAIDHGSAGKKVRQQ